MTVDANEHSKEQRFNAKIESLEKKVAHLLWHLIALAREVAGPDDAPEVELAIQRMFNELDFERTENLSGIAEAAKLLRELEKDD